MTVTSLWRPLLLCAFGVLAVLPAAGQGAFPYGRDLLLDARPMRPGKRMPGLTVAPDGRAAIDLWCRSVGAQVTVTGDTVRIEIAELPPEPPAQQSRDQCTPERMSADETLRQTLLGATEWRLKGEAVELKGAATLLYRPMTN